MENANWLISNNTRDIDIGPREKEREEGGERRGEREKGRAEWSAISFTTSDISREEGIGHSGRDELAYLSVIKLSNIGLSGHKGNFIRRGYPSDDITMERHNHNIN